MKITETHVYAARNCQVDWPAIGVQLELGELAGRTPADLDAPRRAAVDSLLQSLAVRADDLASAPRPWPEPDADEQAFAELYLRVALLLQQAAAQTVCRGEVKRGDSSGCYRVYYEFEHPQIGETAAGLALECLTAALGETSLMQAEVEAQVSAFSAEAAPLTLSRDTAALVKAAQARDIPWIKVDRWPFDAVEPASDSREDRHGFLQLGQGCRQRRVQGTLPDRASASAMALLSDRAALLNRLSQAGVTVPRHDAEFPNANGVRRVVRSAKRVGFPVSLWAMTAPRGHGRCEGLSDSGQVETACEVLSRWGRRVWVEGYATGRRYRLLVVGRELVAAAECCSAAVAGDGQHTVKQLIDQLNSAPSRGLSLERRLTRVSVDDELHWQLARQALGLASVPAAGRQIRLSSSTEIVAGATARDVAEAVHPQVAAMAVEAAAAVGLVWAGVDYVAQGVAEEPNAAGGFIVGVDPAPDLRAHLCPKDGQGRDVATAMLAALIPPGTETRVPMVAITGTNGKTTTCRMVAAILRHSGKTVGLGCSDGIFVNDECLREGDQAGAVAHRWLQHVPEVEAVVLETARGGLLRDGIGFDTCDAAACLNVTEDHIGSDGIDTLEQMAKLKRLLVEAARGTAVLNADDPLTLAMAPHMRARHVCLVAAEGGCEALGEHVASGGRACVLEGSSEELTIYAGGLRVPLLAAAEIPATWAGRARHNVENALFAAALTHSLGIEPSLIAEALRSFGTSYETTPGRLNLYSGLPFPVIMDYAHNAAGLANLCAMVDRTPVKGRRILVFTAPSDRQADTIRHLGQVAAGHFDRYICKNYRGTRGRDPAFVPTLLREGLLLGGVDAERIDRVPNGVEALERALDLARPDDLVVFITGTSQKSEFWKLLKQRADQRGSDLAATALDADPASTASRG